MRNIQRIASVMVLVLVAGSCIENVIIDIPEDCTGIEWHYEGHSGPGNWQNLCLGFAECGGLAQSPINITTPPASSGQGGITLNYTTSITNIVNNGHTIQFNYSPGSTMSWRGDTWELLQFHMHTASEHTINGASYPMEVHLVHRNQTGELAVVGILFESGSSNAFLSPFLSSLPTSKGQTVQSSASYTVKDVFPTTLGHYQYDGSLTTPPCSQGVNWIVLSEPVTASSAELTLFRSIMHQNNRPVQPLNGRQVKRFE